MDKTTCGNQMTFITEDELAELRLKAAWADKQYKMIMDAAHLLYPDVEIWADVGTGFSISLNVLTKMETDLFKFLDRKPKIVKKHWWQKDKDSEN